MWRTRRVCTLCHHDLADDDRVLRLAPTPPANEFLPLAKLSPLPELFPLDVVQCPGCGHVQLGGIVSPERLFRNYVYVSGTSPSFVRHFRSYAEAIDRDTPVGGGRLVVDIGSNDGTLLQHFKALGARVLGVDPARDIAVKAGLEGIPTRVDFFNQEVAYDIVRTHGRARVVTANNVFAHAEDLEEIARGALALLEPRGVFVFEVSYLLDVVDALLFDTIYHEHASYHSVRPLVPFFERLGATLGRVERVPTHGGSIRCFVRPGRRNPDDTVQACIEAEEERGLYHPGTYLLMKQRIKGLGKSLRNRLDDLAEAHKLVVGYGAPAKLTTLCYELGVERRDLAFVVDDSPWKQGLVSPGLGIPVVGPEKLMEAKPDVVLVFAWNFADAIVEKHRGLGASFIVPLPIFKEVRP